MPIDLSSRKVSDIPFADLAVGDRVRSDRRGHSGTIINLVPNAETLGHDGDEFYVRWDHNSESHGLSHLHVGNAMTYVGRFKHYCLMSMEAVKLMNGARGKMTSQAGHAFLHAFWDAEDRFPEAALHYRKSQKAYKITLQVPDEDTLVTFKHAYEGRCGVSMVRDAAHTVFKEPTVTCLGLGPINVDLIGDDLKGLKVL